MRLNQPDIVVVGGGIAGASLSTVLARSGIRVLLLERQRAYRDRVRGEYMAPWGVLEARALGLEDVIRSTRAVDARYSVGYDELGGPVRRRGGQEGQLDRLSRRFRRAVRVPSQDVPGARGRRRAFRGGGGLRRRGGAGAAGQATVGHLSRRQGDRGATASRHRRGRPHVDGAQAVRHPDEQDPGHPRGHRPAGGGRGQVAGGPVHDRRRGGLHVLRVPAGRRPPPPLHLPRERAGDPVGRARRARSASSTRSPGCGPSRNRWAWAWSRRPDRAGRSAGTRPGATSPARNRVVLAGDAGGYDNPVDGQGLSLALRDVRALSELLVLVSRLDDCGIAPVRRAARPNGFAACGACPPPMRSS